MAANPFTDPVNLSITGLPAGATASFSPSTVIPGAAGATSTLTVKTPPVLAQMQLPARSKYTNRECALSFAGLFGCVLIGLRRRRTLVRPLALGIFGCVTLMALSATGCGAGTGFAIPTSTSTLIVTATSSTTVHITTVTLTIK